MKMVLIVAVLTASILFSSGLVNQAQAFNLLLSVGSQQVEDVVKMAKKEDELILQDNEQTGVEERMQQVEPAAG